MATLFRAICDEALCMLEDTLTTKGDLNAALARGEKHARWFGRKLKAAKGDHAAISAVLRESKKRRQKGQTFIN